MIKHNIDDIPRQAHLKELWDKIDAINKYLEEELPYPTTLLNELV